MIVMPLLVPISITSTTAPYSYSILLMMGMVWAEFHQFSAILSMAVVIMIMVVVMMMVIVMIMTTGTCPVNALQHFVWLFRLRWTTVTIAMLVAITVATCCAAHCAKVSTWQACQIILT